MARNERSTSRLAVVIGAATAASALLLAPPSRADEAHRSDRANEVHAERENPPAATPPEAAPPAEPAAPAAAQPAPGAQPPEEAPQPPAAQPAAGDAEGSPAPGNAGTVKIHRTETPDDDRRNEPHVCGFRIVGFGFPADAELAISIVGHGGPNAGSGSFTASVPATALSPAGDWAIAGPALPDGMYKLAVENTTAPGGAKQKVFKVDCGDEVAPAAGTSGSVSGAAGAVAGAGGAAGAAAGETATAAAAAAAPAGITTEVLGASVSASPAPAAGAAAAAPAPVAEVAGATLARTGTGIAALVLLGLCLVLAGDVLRRRAAPLAP